MSKEDRVRALLAKYAYQPSQGEPASELAKLLMLWDEQAVTDEDLQGVADRKELVNTALMRFTLKEAKDK